MTISNNKPGLHPSELARIYKKAEDALVKQMTKTRDEWNRLEREKAKKIDDTDKQIAQLKTNYKSLEKKVQEKRDLQLYHKSMAQTSTPPNFQVPTSPPPQHNPSSLQQRNVVTPIGSQRNTTTNDKNRCAMPPNTAINNPYAKPGDRYATKPPTAPVQSTGGSSAIFDASKYEEESALNAPAPKVQEEQQEKHEDAAQDLNEFFENSHNEEEEEDMVLATMNSSEKAEYMWEKYGKEEPNDKEEFLRTDGHSNGKEWQNEVAELEQLEMMNDRERAEYLEVKYCIDAEKAENMEVKYIMRENEKLKAKEEAKKKHDRKTAFASQDPTKSTVAADVTATESKRKRKRSLKVIEMEDATSQGGVNKKEKIDLKNLV